MRGDPLLTTSPGTKLARSYN
uniref:Uncharacterized protein n=1 Tax=Anguilla anguilla TaxID=7936 RepID=A0A0E9U4E1_ANGAN